MVQESRTERMENEGRSKKLQTSITFLVVTESSHDVCRTSQGQFLSGSQFFSLPGTTRC